MACLYHSRVCCETPDFTYDHFEKHLFTTYLLLAQGELPPTTSCDQTYENIALASRSQELPVTLPESIVTEVPHFTSLPSCSL